MILLSSHSPSVKSVAGNGDSPGGCREGRIPMDVLISHLRILKSKSKKFKEKSNYEKSYYLFKK
jgi:hypothetical protein